MCLKIPEYKGEYKTIRQDGAYIPSGENDNLIVSKLTIDKDAFEFLVIAFSEQFRQNQCC